MPGLELIYMVLSVAFVLVFIVMAIFMLFMMFQAMKAPRAYYPPRPTAYELAKELTCPKCGSKDMEPTGYYTIKCRSCGFIFSIGRERLCGYHSGWWFWSMIGWPFFWIYPMAWQKGKASLNEAQ